MRKGLNDFFRDGGGGGYEYYYVGRENVPEE